MELSVIALAERIPTEADAYAFLEELRWGDKPVCPHCDSERVYFLTPANGTSRKTRTGSISQRRVWKCGACRRQFTVLVGTIFHGTKISLRKWLFVVVEMCSAKNGISAREIERRYDLTPKSAWFMTHRIREAMKRDPLAGMLQGVIVADETYIGGAEKNKHARDRTHPGGGPHHKVAVLSLIEEHTGEVRSRIVPDVTGMTLRKAMEQDVESSGSILYTDQLAGYTALGQSFVAHETVDHGAGPGRWTLQRSCGLPPGNPWKLRACGRDDEGHGETPHLRAIDLNDKCETAGVGHRDLEHQGDGDRLLLADPEAGRATEVEGNSHFDRRRRVGPLRSPGDYNCAVLADTRHPEIVRLVRGRPRHVDDGAHPHHDHVWRLWLDPAGADAPSVDEQFAFGGLCVVAEDRIYFHRLLQSTGVPSGTLPRLCATPKDAMYDTMEVDDGERRTQDDTKREAHWAGRSRRPWRLEVVRPS